MIQLDRQFYIPKGAVKVADKLSDAVAYLYTAGNGKPGAVGFHGKAMKPDFRFYYQDEARREASVRRFFENRRARLKATAEQRQVRQRPSKLEVGHILVASWGYDQTNIDYFQVTRIISAGMVEVREIGAQTVQETGWATGRSVPAIDAFKGEPMRRRVKYGDMVRIDDVRQASLWEGRPMNWTAYH